LPIPLSTLPAQTSGIADPTPRTRETSRPLTLLVVTREHSGEKRYGLGRSIAPVLAELGQRHITHRYLCQADLDEGARTAIRRWHSLLVRAASRLSAKTDWVVLIQVLLERMAMGRLAAQVLAREHYDLVHCHDPVIATGLRLFSLFRLRRRRWRWGVTLHGFGSFFEALREHGIHLGPRAAAALRQLEARILRSADWVVTPARLGIEQLARDLEIESVPATWHALPHPRPSEIKRYVRGEARETLGWPADETYVLAIGRHDSVKDFPRLITACAGLHSSSRLHIVILGEGDYDALRRQAGSVGLGHDLILTVTDDVGLYLSAADIYVSTSTTESFGIANLEALHIGVPAVCTSVGGVPEVVGDAALLIPPADTDAIRQALQRLLDDGELRAHLTERGRARAAAWPDVTTTADTYEKIYRLAVAKKTG
jgi:glycosyltransferase involved in cell wall biosynthesis